MRNQKAIITEENTIEMKQLIRCLDNVGLDYASFATDPSSVDQFLKSEQPLFLLANLNQSNSKEINNLLDYLKKLNATFAFLINSNNYPDKIFQKKEETINKAAESLDDPKNSLSPSNQIKGNIIFVKIGKVFKKILLSDIDYIFYEDRHANLKIEQKNIPIKISMKKLAESLPESQFIQIHQAHIINLSKITQINLSNCLVEVQGKWLPIGVKFLKTFKESISLFS